MGAAWIGLFGSVTVAIIVAIVGPAIERRRRREADDPADEMDLMRSMASALESEIRRSETAERRLAECEEARRRPS